MADNSIVDVDGLLLEISPEAPCGTNLEYDPAFLELEQVVKGKPEVQYGDTITPATPPDWKSAKAMSLELLGRSRDLRIAVTLARALLCLHGMRGFAAGLRLVERMLAQYWDGLHPQLDPDDGNDPMLRVNTLAGLCEPGATLRDAREAVLVASRAHGRFSLRDIDIVTGELDMPEGDGKPTLAVIDAAFLDVDQAELEETDRALSQAYDSCIHIEQVLTEKVGVAQALDMSPLTRLLKRACNFVHEHLGRRSAGVGALDAPQPAEEGRSILPDAQPVPPRGEIASRDDVVQMLGKICAYYEKYEPSSPVPLLLQRARRLVAKSFVELLEDLAPDGLNQLCQASGVKRE